MPEDEQVIVVADISGYTRFVMKNRVHWAHAQLIIAGLLDQLVASAEPALRLEKLEGDAAFFVERDLRQPDKAFASRIDSMFEGFATTLREMVDDNGCACVSCVGMENLRLKVVAHRGSVTKQEIAGRQEVSGVAVIVAHRLLKNSVKSNHYLLLTDEALGAYGQDSGSFEKGSVKDSDLGKIDYWLHYPPDPLGLNPAKKVPWLMRKMKAMWLMIRSMPLLLSGNTQAEFRNIDLVNIGGVDV